MSDLGDMATTTADDTHAFPVSVSSNTSESQAAVVHPETKSDNASVKSGDGTPAPFSDNAVSSPNELPESTANSTSPPVDEQRMTGPSAPFVSLPYLPANPATAAGYPFFSNPFMGPMIPNHAFPGAPVDLAAPQLSQVVGHMSPVYPQNMNAAMDVASGDAPDYQSQSVPMPAGFDLSATHPQGAENGGAPASMNNLQQQQFNPYLYQELLIRYFQAMMQKSSVPQFPGAFPVPTFGHLAQPLPSRGQDVNSGDPNAFRDVDSQPSASWPEPNVAPAESSVPQLPSNNIAADPDQNKGTAGNGSNDPDEIRDATIRAVVEEAKEDTSALLIKKQISEIEREINRRLQNQNVRKDSPTPPSAAGPGRSAADNGALVPPGNDPAPAPMAPLSAEAVRKFAPTPLRGPARLDESFVSHLIHGNDSDVALQSFNSRVAPTPVRQPEVPVSMPPPGPSRGGGLILQQRTLSGEATLAADVNSLTLGDDASGPAEMRPRASSDTSEPVWIYRESYLRKVQREEERERAAGEAKMPAQPPNADEHDSDTDNETNRLLGQRPLTNGDEHDHDKKKLKKRKKEVMVHEPAVLIEGVLFRAHYLGSTQIVCEGRPTKATRMVQAQEAVGRIKAPDGENQPATEVDLFISTEKIMVLNTDVQDIMMDHPLRTISYIADIGDLVVLMARRIAQPSTAGEPLPPGGSAIRRMPRIICHVFESDEAQFIAQSIGQAFQVAYLEFLRQNGIEDPSYLRELDYQEVLNSQEMIGDELEFFAKRELQKDVIIPKQRGEPLGVVIVESGWGSMLPTVVVANLQPAGPAARSSQLNIGDQVISMNGISFVGLPLATCQNHIKICSLLRGGIAERGGVRVGHRIIEIGGQSVVAVPHEKIVTMLATACGEIQMKTMPTSMFRLLTGQEVPVYI